MNRMMKAIVCNQYGSPDLLEVKDIEKPTPTDDEVLVKVHATSINYNNLLFVKGEPFIGRFWTGLTKPKLKVTGNDIAGIVEAVGKNITQFQPGDEVFGDTIQDGSGAFAEYVSVSESTLTIKPTNISFEEAAALPEASLVALQALQDGGKIQAGNKVLIYGASGGIGTFAVQIAKYFNAEVTAVCGTSNIEMVRSIGADHVIDYKKEDFTKSDELYDLIVATAGHRSIKDYKRKLKPKGIYVATGGSMKQIFQAMLLGPIISESKGRKLTNMLLKPNMDLELIKELIETDKIKAVIDRCYKFEEIPEALQYYEKGHSKGKVVITVNHNNDK